MMHIITTINIWTKTKISISILLANFLHNLRFVFFFKWEHKMKQMLCQQNNDTYYSKKTKDLTAMTGPPKNILNGMNIIHREQQSFNIEMPIQRKNKLTHFI